MRSILLVLFLSLLSSSLFSQNTYSNEIEEKIKAFENGLAGRIKIEGEADYNILERMKALNVKGLSIAVVHNYKIEWAKAYGWADEAEKRKLTTETLFEPGSISKSLNAVGILKLVQDKKLDLNVDINNYLTSWKFPYDALSKNKKITLAHLLSHSAGLTVHGFPGYDQEEKKPSLPQVLDGTPPANTPAVRSQFEPGLKFQYSGGGTTISQLILTDVTKQAYDVFMYENVLKPMGMLNSSYSQPPAKDKLALCSSAYHKDGSPVPHKFHVYPEQAAAGLWMTPSDLCNYIIETQLAYEGKSSKVLNQEMTKLRLTPYNDESAALGVFIENHNNSIYFQHSAGNEGFCGQYFGSLEGGNGVVVFLNTDDFTIIPEIINSIASVYKWKDFYNPVTKKAIAVSDKEIKKFEGIYLYDDKWSRIFKKDGQYCFYTDGLYAKMYFTSPTEFFNKEFPSEKNIQLDSKGNVTGYLRKVNNKEYPAASKISNIDTLSISKDMFNSIAWHLIENRNYAEAASYLNRALKLTPGDLILLGNLAHCYLFNNNYSAAIEIYKAHLKEKVEGYVWEDMIAQDFMYFKNNGFDKASMEKVFAELKYKTPEGF